MTCFHSKKSIALVLAYTMIASMLVIGAAQLKTAVVDARGATRSFESQKSLWAAEAGIAYARKALKTSTWTGWTGTTTKTKTLTLGKASYTVTVNTGVSPVTISAVGTTTFGSSSSSFPKTVTLTASSPSLFRYAVFAQNDFIVNSNADTDSYDSRTGAYNSTSNHGSDGDIGTNGDLIVLNSNAHVSGDIVLGAGGAVTLNSGSTVSGTIRNGNTETFAAPTVPTSVSSVASSGSYNLNSGATATKPAGTYVYSDLNLNSNSTLTFGSSATDETIIYVTSNFNLNSNSRLVINGKVTFYLSGSVGINSGAVVNNSMDPTKCIMYATGGAGQNVSLNSNVNFYGAVYAPQASVSLNSNVDTFGAIVTGSFNFNSQASIHYDEALSTLGGGSGYTFSNWNEV